MTSPNDTVVASSARLPAEAGQWWVYVIDHDRRRFAVATVPVNSPFLWQRRVDDARTAGDRNLESGVIPVSEASTIAAATAVVKAKVQGLEQYDPRVIFATTQPPSRAATKPQRWR
jgi:hypothetical protein